MNFAEFLRKDIENFLKYYSKHERSERLSRLKSISEISVLEKVQYSQLKSAINKSDNVSVDKVLESLKSTFKNSNEDIKNRILKVLEENASNSSGNNSTNPEVLSALKELKSQMGQILSKNKGTGSFFSNDSVNSASSTSNLQSKNMGGGMQPLPGQILNQPPAQVIKYVPVSNDYGLNNSVFSTPDVSNSVKSNDDPTVDDYSGMNVPFKKGTGKVVLLPGNISMDHGTINFTDPNGGVEVFENGVVKPYGKINTPSVYELELKAELKPLHMNLVRNINAAIIREDSIAAKSLINDLIFLYKKYPSKFKNDKELILSDIASFRERVDTLDARVDADFIKDSVTHRNIGSGHSVVYSSEGLDSNLRVDPSKKNDNDIVKSIDKNLGDDVTAVDSMLDSFEIPVSKIDDSVNSISSSEIDLNSIDSGLFSYSKFLKSSTLSNDDVIILKDLLSDFKSLRLLIIDKNLLVAETKYDNLFFRVKSLYGSKFIDYKNKLLEVLKYFLKVISFLKEKSFMDSLNSNDSSSNSIKFNSNSVKNIENNDISDDDLNVNDSIKNKVDDDAKKMNELYLTGVSLFYDSDFVGAKSIFEKVLKLNKNNRAALIRLNQCIEKMGGDLNE